MFPFIWYDSATLRSHARAADSITISPFGGADEVNFCNGIPNDMKIYDWKSTRIPVAFAYTRHTPPQTTWSALPHKHHSIRLNEKCAIQHRMCSLKTVGTSTANGLNNVFRISFPSTKSEREADAGNRLTSVYLRAHQIEMNTRAIIIYIRHERIFSIAVHAHRIKGE